VPAFSRFLGLVWGSVGSAPVYAKKQSVPVVCLFVFIFWWWIDVWFVFVIGSVPLDPHLIILFFSALQLSSSFEALGVQHSLRSATGFALRCVLSSSFEALGVQHSLRSATGFVRAQLSVQLRSAWGATLLALSVQLRSAWGATLLALSDCVLRSAPASKRLGCNTPCAQRPALR
jgi:hypothetical protein